MHDELLQHALRALLPGVLAVLIATCGSHARAEGIYRWIGANNVPTFSQLPPGDGIRAERLGDARPIAVATSHVVVSSAFALRRASARRITPEMRRMGIRLADTPTQQAVHEARDAGVAEHAWRVQ